MTKGQRAVHDGETAALLDELDSRLGAVDPDAIAAAVSKGLSARFDAQANEIEALRAEVAALTARVNGN